jgi:hypothetical protein
MWHSVREGCTARPVLVNLERLTGTGFFANGETVEKRENAKGVGCLAPVGKKVPISERSGVSFFRRN